MTANLRIQLLGEFRLLVDNQPLLNLNKPRQQALLAYLLLHRHAPQPRQQVAFCFWPDSSEGQAYSNLRKLFFQLRQALPDADTFLAADTLSLGWRMDASFTFDVAEVERALDRLGNAALPMPETVGEVLALYTRELLPNCYDDWIFPIRRALHERVVNTLTQALASLEAQHEYRMALRTAEHLLRLDPFHEATYRNLMHLHALSGDRTGALRIYQECLAMLERELEAPPMIETTLLYQDILTRHLDLQRGEPPSQELDFAPDRNPTALRHNLPGQLTRFVGREKELEVLDELLMIDDMRLITVIGPGGMGKTRLVLEAARRQVEAETISHRDAFVHGVYFVALASLSEPAQIVPALADALGFALDSGSSQTRTPKQQVLDYLCEKQTLLVLDNFEHLLEGVTLLADILQTTQSVRLLITSRERLRLPGEQVYPIAGLAIGTPERRENTDEPAAVMLFVQSARRVQPEPLLSQGDMDNVGRICRLVEGMPLAIELAAAWIEALSVTEILQELRNSLDFLAIERRGVPERHFSMRAVFDTTWQRINEHERVIFASLSVFRGGFTREAAQVITSATIHHLSSLISKSLIQHDQEHSRYMIHELLRQYGAWRLSEQPEQQQATCYRHRDYYFALLQRQQEALKGREELAALAVLDTEHENVITAWRWSVTQGHVAQLAQIMNGMGLYCQLRQLAEEGASLFEAATEPLEQSGATRLLAHALSWRTAFVLMLQQFDLAAHLLSRGRQLLDSLMLAHEDVRGERAFSLLQMGTLAFAQGKWMDHSFYDESLALFEELNEPWYSAQVLMGLGTHTNAIGDYGAMRVHFQKALALHRISGNERGIAMVLAWLSVAERLHGRPESSLAMGMESLTAAQRLGDRAGVSHSLQAIGLAQLVLGEVANARQALLKSAASYGEIGDRREQSVTYYMLCAVEMAAGDYVSARASVQRALDTNTTRWEDNHPMMGAFLSFLGWATLYTDSPQEALRSLQKGVTIVEGVADRCYSYALLSFGEWKSGLHDQARFDCFCGLRLGIQCADQMAVSIVLSTAAALLAERENPERAMELYGWLRQYPFCGSAAWWLETVGSHLEAMMAGISGELANAALNRGEGLDLWQTVADLLDELLALGWEDKRGASGC